jgi:hypothetical protein
MAQTGVGYDAFSGIVPNVTVGSERMAMSDDRALFELIETARKASPGAMARIVAFAREAVQVEAKQDEAEREAWLDSAEPLEPYDWGNADPAALGQRVTYIEGVGAVVRGG